MNYIRQTIEDMRQEQMLDGIAARQLSEHRGSTRGDNSKDYCRCPNCNRATVLIEHTWTPQLKLIAPLEEREGEYFTCEWCDAVIDPGELRDRAPKKPAVSVGWESETEWARRMA